MRAYLDAALGTEGEIAGGLEVAVRALPTLAAEREWWLQNRSRKCVDATGAKHDLLAYGGGAGEGGLQLECLAILCFKRRHPHVENRTRDDHSSKDESK